MNLPITTVLMPGFTPHRHGHAATVITQHVMLGTEAGTRAAFRQGKKSSNFGLAADGTITCYVPPAHSAWANGNMRNPALWIPAVRGCWESGVNPNDVTISIEWEGTHRLDSGAWGMVPYTDPRTGKTEQVETLVKAKVLSLWQPPPAQWAAGLELTKQLCTDYHIPLDRTHLLRHSDFDSVGKWFCPGDGFPLAKLIRELGGTI